MRDVIRAGLMFTLAAAVCPAGVLAQGGLVVEETAVAPDVVDRVPVDPDSTFTADVGRLFCWTRVAGASGETTIHHVWFRGDDQMADIELSVGGSPWRTWSNKRILPEWTGDWRIEVRDAQGNVLETVRFSVGG